MCLPLLHLVREAIEAVDKVVRDGKIRGGYDLPSGHLYVQVADAVTNRKTLVVSLIIDIIKGKFSIHRNICTQLGAWELFSIIDNKNNQSGA